MVRVTNLALTTADEAAAGFQVAPWSVRSVAPALSWRCAQRPHLLRHGDVYVYGSLSVVRTLLTARLVDELVLMIEPITLGGGKTLFPHDGELREFELTSARTARTGVQVCRYQPVSAEPERS